MISTTVNWISGGPTGAVFRWAPTGTTDWNVVKATQQPASPQGGNGDAGTYDVQLAWTDGDGNVISLWSRHPDDHHHVTRAPGKAQTPLAPPGGGGSLSTGG
jgi:hypothetical protein